jgi:acetyl esterase/lipase
MMKILLTLACTSLLMLYALNAKAEVWQPPSGYTQIPLWPKGKMPDALPSSKPESVQISAKPFLGKAVTVVYDVSQPTMTIYAPKENNTSVAVVVFPGGGFNGLAIDLEGTEICQWLTSVGITAVLLKYRVPDSGPAWHMDCHCNIHPKAPTALEDAQRALGLLRLNAQKWHINPNKIGVLGFSSGGYMVADISSHFKNRAYAPIDAADQESSRPDFSIALYPGHMQQRGKSFVLNPHIVFTKATPPTFLLQAENDPMDDINNSLLYYMALKKAGVPVEMHLYAEGGHGFALRQTKLPLSHWPQLVETWLRTIGIITNI